LLCLAPARLQGKLLCVSHHMGKNPYASLDPLGLQNQPQRAEWKSLTWVTGAI